MGKQPGGIVGDKDDEDDKRDLLTWKAIHGARHLYRLAHILHTALLIRSPSQAHRQSVDRTGRLCMYCARNVEDHLVVVGLPSSRALYGHGDARSRASGPLRAVWLQCIQKC